MSVDVQINNDIAIQILSFETRIGELGPDGKRAEVDWVTYSPQADVKTVISRPIHVISAVLSLDECGDNVASLIAHKRWFDVIKPNYDYWKEANKLPEFGTPLAAWPGVSAAQAEVLRKCGLSTVESIRDASDIVLGKTGLANVLRLRDTAKKYLDGIGESIAASENATLKAQIAEMQAMMAELVASQKASEGEKPAKGRKAKEAA